MDCRVDPGPDERRRLRNKRQEEEPGGAWTDRGHSVYSGFASSQKLRAKSSNTSMLSFNHVRSIDTVRRKT